MAPISKQVSDLSGKLDAFIVAYNLEKELDIQRQKSFREYLERDVSRALNSHKEIKDKIEEHSREISEIKLNEAKCPILNLSEESKHFREQVKLDIGELRRETELSRMKDKYPEVKKGLNIFLIISTGLSLLTIISLILIIILNWQKIF